MPSPGTQISLAYARQLVKNYEDEKLNHVLPPEDTKAIWFSKDTILKALGLPPETILPDGRTGLRFYYGAYGEQQGYPQNPEYYNMMTLVMITTGEDKIELEGGDFAYADIIDEEDLTSRPQAGYPGTGGMTTTKTPVFNEGQMAPPPPPPTGASLGLINWP